MAAAVAEINYFSSLLSYRNQEYHECLAEHRVFSREHYKIDLFRQMPKAEDGWRDVMGDDDYGDLLFELDTARARGLDCPDKYQVPMDRDSLSASADIQFEPSLRPRVCRRKEAVSFSRRPSQVCLIADDVCIQDVLVEAKSVNKKTSSMRLSDDSRLVRGLDRSQRLRAHPSVFDPLTSEDDVPIYSQPYPDLVPVTTSSRSSFLRDECKSQMSHEPPDRLVHRGSSPQYVQRPSTPRDYRLRDGNWKRVSELMQAGVQVQHSASPPCQLSDEEMKRRSILLGRSRSIRDSCMHRTTDTEAPATRHFNWRSPPGNALPDNMAMPHSRKHESISIQDDAAPSDRGSGKSRRWRIVTQALTAMRAMRKSRNRLQENPPSHCHKGVPVKKQPTYLTRTCSLRVQSKQAADVDTQFTYFI